MAIVMITGLLFVSAVPLANAQRRGTEARTQIAVYYFPGYHRSPVFEKDHEAGWTNWNVIQKATPRFPGHHQPKVPAWGYEDESNPEVFAKKIAAAADHGVHAFIFDWYWSGGAPVLEDALRLGYGHASNSNRLKFALMWANHDIFGPVTRAVWDQVTDYMIATYFRQPSYWTIDGKPYFSVYEPVTLLRSLGGVEATRAAFNSFREKASAAGLPGIHLNLIERDTDLSMATQLGADSITNYTWYQMVRLRDFPLTRYSTLIQPIADYWDKSAKAYAPVPFIPNVTMGWDPSPQTDQHAKFEQKEYPYTPTIGNNTPEQFEKALREARKFAENGRQSLRVVIINAWNEWIEGSYLEPDTVNQLGYLEAIEKVFKE